MKSIFSPLEPIYVKEGLDWRLPEVLYRIDKSSLRFYFQKRPRSINYFLSATSFSQISLPTSPHLVEWKVQLGEEAEIITREAADYGTFAHDVLLKFAITGFVDMDQLLIEIREFLELNNHSHTLAPAWLHNLEYDLVAWAEFCEQHEVEVIAVEYPMYGYNAFRIAGSIDLVCRLKVVEWGHFGEVYKRKTKDHEAGDPKLSKGKVEYHAIVDLKTGRKSFYESHEFQLACYRKIWNYHFGKVFNVQKVFNWRPKDWRSEDSISKFALKDQSDSMMHKCIMDYYNVARKLGRLQPNLKSLVTKPTLTRDKEISAQFNILPHEKYIKAVDKGKVSAHNLL